MSSQSSGVEDDGFTFDPQLSMDEEQGDDNELGSIRNQLFTPPQRSPTTNNDVTGVTLLKNFVEDQSKVPADGKISYLLMVARGVVPGIPLQEDISNIEPFNDGIKAKLCWRKNMKLYRDLMKKEIIRRNPNRHKLNFNNKKLVDLFAVLQEEPLYLEEDIQYVKSTVEDHIKTINDALAEASTNAQDTLQQSKIDRLRYLCAIEEFDDIRHAYLNSQDTMSREQLDGRNSDRLPPDFHDLTSEKFNDDEWEPLTSAMKTLHADFVDPIPCLKREGYSMNRDRSIALIAKFRAGLDDICDRYNRSGNGSLKVQEDEDGNLGEKYGHVDLDKIEKEGLSDDRKGYLKHYGSEFLYAWAVFDTHQLIHFTTARLRGVCAAKSSAIPSKTSYSSRKKPRVIDLDAESMGGSALSINDSLSANVATVGEGLMKIHKSKEQMNEITLMREIDGLRKEKFEVTKEMRKQSKRDDYDDDDKAMYEERLQELTESIDAKMTVLDMIAAKERAVSTRIQES